MSKTKSQKVTASHTQMLTDISNQLNQMNQNIKMELGRLSEDVKYIKDYIYNRKQTTETQSMMQIFEKLSAQNNNVVDMMAEQTTVLKTTLSPIFQIPKHSKMFPIKSNEQLETIEDLINESNNEEIILAVKSTLGPGGIKKGLTNIISKNLLLQYNMDGTQSKKRLKDYKKFMDLLLRASMEDNKPNTFDRDIRTAMKRIKNRHYKLTSFAKKNMNKNVNDIDF